LKSRFDDDYITHRMHELLEIDDIDEITKLMTSSLINRKPPKQLVEFEMLSKKGENPLEDKKKLVRSLVTDISSEYGIDKALMHIWTQRVSPTKVGTYFSVDEVDDINPDKIEQAIRIFCNHKRKPQPIVTMKESLMSVLSNYDYNALRLYILLPSGKEHLLEGIKSKVHSALH